MDTKKEYEDFIEDLCAMASYLFLSNERPELALPNILHDLQGVVNKKKCFRPRCAGYSKYQDSNRDKRG